MSARVLRPDLLQLWPTWAAFPLFGVAVLVLGVQVHDDWLVLIGFTLLALNALLVLDHAYFTTLRIEGDALVYRSHLGLHIDRIPVGSIQRIDAKRYPGTHSGMSAPNLVVRARASTLRVNIKPYRLPDLRSLVETVRALNPSVQLDPFWSAVVTGEDPFEQPVARSRW